MNVRTAGAFAAGAVVALVLGTGTTYAANGGHFVLGRTNNATTYSTLTNSQGTALVARSKAGKPSILVSDTARVPKLNADMVDGLDSSDLARDVNVGTVVAVGELIQNGTTETDDDYIEGVAHCPAGSQVMGGGADDFTEDGVLVSSVPEGNRSWYAVSSATPTEENASRFRVFARCWNPQADVDTDLRQGARVLPRSSKRLSETR